MTAISISAAPTTRLRLTARGRRVLAALAALPIAVAILIAAVSGGAALGSRAVGAAPETFTTITVGAGDSLWSIAEEVAPAADPRDVVDAIVRLNSLEGATVAVGQRLSVPAQYASAP